MTYVSIEKYSRENKKDARDICRKVLNNRKDFLGHMRICNGVIELDNKGTDILNEMIKEPEITHNNTKEMQNGIIAAQRYEASKLQKQEKRIEPWTF